MGSARSRPGPDDDAPVVLWTVKRKSEMGIRFVDSILSLLAATCGVLTAYFVGHGLSEMTAWPWLTAAGLLVAAALLGALTIRRVRSYGEQRDTHRAH